MFIKNSHGETPDQWSGSCSVATGEMAWGFAGMGTVVRVFPLGGCWRKGQQWEKLITFNRNTVNVVVADFKANFATTKGTSG